MNAKIKQLLNEVWQIRYFGHHAKVVWEIIKKYVF